MNYNDPHLQRKIAKLREMYQKEILKEWYPKREEAEDPGPECICDITAAWNQGCQCGRMEWERAQKNK